MACILAIFLKKGGQHASSCLLKLHSEFSAMNFIKSTSRPLPYSRLLSNAIPFASKMRCTFSQVCPQVMVREECISMPVRSHQNEIIIKILQRSVRGWMLNRYGLSTEMIPQHFVAAETKQRQFHPEGRGQHLVFRIGSSNCTYIHICIHRVCNTGNY